MKEEAWLLDDDILLKGIVKRKWFRHIFIPNSFGCGSSYQYIHRKDIGKILFRNDFHIVYAGLGRLERVDNQIEPECYYCVHKGKDFTKIEPCYSCCNPDDNKVVMGFELDKFKYNEFISK
jgi:hypothetical protein